MNKPDDVVITGMGVVSPIGIGLDAFWASLREGRSGVRTLDQFAECRVKFGGEVQDFDPKRYVKPRKSLKVMCREIQLAYAACAMAIEHAGLDIQAGERNRLGVVLGSEMHYSTPEELIAVCSHCLTDGRFDFDQWGQYAMKDISPLWLLKYLPNMAACHIAIAIDARGPNNSIVLGEASSLLAVMEAASIIRRGWADMMLTGGVGSRIHIASVLFRGDANLSHRNDNPSAACRPFDQIRDGTVNSEGAGAMMLESRAHAEARGARILGRVLNGASSFGRRPDRLTAASRPIERSVHQALARPGLGSEQLSHVNAHGISTVDNDAIEARAIHNVLGEVPVTAPKSFFGNIGGGAGAVEAVASLLALRAHEIPRTLNFETPDARCPINVVREPTSCQKRTALLLNQS